MSITAAELVRMVDHTLLTPGTTTTQAAALAQEAAELGVHAICISPQLLPIPLPAGLRLATVCGFPSGAHTASVKATEAAEAVIQGADEIDMVINLGLVKAGNLPGLTSEISAVRSAVPQPRLLKVIIESALLTDAEIVLACQAAQAAGADFVKTSTGFHPAGGATVHAVALMAATVGPKLGVKASGGIRTWADATAMVAAGATRLGLSGTAAVLAGAPQD